MVHVPDWVHLYRSIMLDWVELVLESFSTTVLESFPSLYIWVVLLESLTDNRNYFLPLKESFLVKKK